MYLIFTAKLIIILVVNVFYVSLLQIMFKYHHKENLNKTTYCQLSDYQQLSNKTYTFLDE